MQGHIRKRGKKWQLAIYLGKVGGKKKYKYETFDREEEAQRRRTELLHQINTNTFVDNKITFEEFLNRFLEDYCAVAVKPRTYKRYEEIIRLHTIPELGHIPLIKLQPLDIQKHYTKLLRSGRKGNKYKDNRGLSPTTVLHHHRTIHKALEMAVKWQLVIRNVADAVEPPRKADTEFEVVSVEEILTILKNIKEKCPIISLPILVAASCGLRRGEVLGLRWKDVDLKNKTFRVKQTIYREKGQGLQFDSTKNKSSQRNIDIPEFVVEILKKHKAQQNKLRLAAKPKWKHDLVFCWTDGQAIDPDYLTKRFIKLVRKLDFGNLRLHDLRHSFATMLLGSNVALKKVSEALGHASVSITGDTYSHFTPSMGDEIAQIVQNEFIRAGFSDEFIPDCQGIVRKARKSG